MARGRPDLTQASLPSQLSEDAVREHVWEQACAYMVGHGADKEYQPQSWMHGSQVYMSRTKAEVSPEVMASGTPVLAEANTMMEELIEPGVNGALWLGDPVSLGRVMAELLNKPNQLRQWGEQARERLKPK